MEFWYLIPLRNNRQTPSLQIIYWQKLRKNYNNIFNVKKNYL